MRSLLQLILAMFCAAATRPDLSGRITSSDGRPLANATAYVYTAGVKVGASAFCPSCYPDCGKSSVTDADGVFTLRSLDPELRFRILVAADGYKPAFITGVDPAEGKWPEAKLDPMPRDLEPTHVLKGRVIDPKGQPVLGAIVTPHGCKTADRRWWGSMPGVDAMSITNSRGEFILTSDKPAIAYDLRIEARGLARRNFALVPLGAEERVLQLSDGATVAGRILKDGKPLANVEIGLVQHNRGVEDFVGAETIGTDAQGRFSFVNVGPSGDWYVYGLMHSIGSQGAVAAETVRVLGDNSVSDVGDLVVSASHTLSGRVVLSDGQPIPPKTRLTVSRDGPWDSQTVILDADGRFSVSGLPTESFHVFTSVKGYHLSRQNRSLELLNLTFLRGRIDRDINDLTILLEPGPIQRPDPASRMDDGAKSFKLGQLPLEGARS
jgi:hypothetical protein